MLRTASSRLTGTSLAAALLLVVLHAGTAVAQSDSAAQENEAPDWIVSTETALSGTAAELRFELANGSHSEFALRDGRAWIDGRAVGAAPLGGELDRSWRDLLENAGTAATADLPRMLVDWQAPAGDVGEALDTALEAALAGAPTGQDAAARDDAEAGPSDTVARLNQRIAELEEKLDRADAAQMDAMSIHVDEDRWRGWMHPLNRIGAGIANLFSTLALYVVLVGLGFVAVFFGRRYLEGVADTARHATLRSGLVGLAGQFLVLPAFILGIVALVISVVGIPLLLVWVPLFPVAVVLAAFFGYLGVGHAAGEALAERRFYGGEWFKRANSYYYILTGIGLLLALFVAAHVVHMAGPWLDFISGLLMFLAVVLTWAVFTIGFGAVLLSRAGTSPLVPGRRTGPDLNVGDVFEEESHV